MSIFDKCQNMCIFEKPKHWVYWYTHNCCYNIFLDTDLSSKIYGYASIYHGLLGVLCSHYFGIFIIVLHFTWMDEWCNVSGCKCEIGLMCNFGKPKHFCEAQI